MIKSCLQESDHLSKSKKYEQEAGVHIRTTGLVIPLQLRSVKTRDPDALKHFNSNSVCLF